MSEKDDSLPVILPASDLNLNFPKPSDLVDPKAADRIQKAISKYGGFTPDGETLMDRRAIKTLLSTDQAGANKVVTELPESAKIEDGKRVLIRTAPLNQELSRRIQEPRDAQVHQALKYSEACMNSMRDNPELEVRRHVLESKNEKEMAQAKADVLAQSTHCISGQPLGPDAQVHHVERVADQPRKSADPANLKAVNPGPHKEIHAAAAHSQAELDKLAQEKGWPSQSSPQPQPKP